MTCFVRENSKTHCDLAERPSLGWTKILLIAPTKIGAAPNAIVLIREQGCRRHARIRSFSAAKGLLGNVGSGT